MATALVADKEQFSLGFEATELRLGLPGDGETAKSNGKRGFSETIDLKLKLQTVDSDETSEEPERMKKSVAEKSIKEPEKPPAK